MRRLLIPTAIALTSALSAQTRPAGDPINLIREADIKADLFTLAGDEMRGREGGTLDEMAASVWLAERARAAGMLPAGDNGTYFQFFPLERYRVSASSPVTLGGKTLVMGRDVVPDAMVLATVDAPVAIVVMTPETMPVVNTNAPAGTAGPQPTPHAGKVLVVRYNASLAPATAAGAPQAGPGSQIVLRNWARNVQRTVGRGTAAIVVVVPDSEQAQWERVSAPFTRGTYTLDPDGAAVQRTPAPGAPLLYVRESALGPLDPSRHVPLADDARLTATIFTDSFTYPSVNVVAKVPGRDPALAGEYVLFSAHQDHDGERYPVNGDAIWNGADDNATTSVALLAIGRAMAASPGRRSALFIWHGAEERGLMGSRWYVKHPTVSLKSIVAVLNGDMMGRNDPKVAALLGAIPPHRNSPELVDMAHKANQSVSQFEVDSSWDQPEHREGWYYRSDHLPYARSGIPALFFTTLLHPDYHTPFDNPDRIDIAKLTRMTRWMYATGRAVAERDAPPALDPTFKLERCRDFTGNYCG
jgi:hypothetical protein